MKSRDKPKLSGECFMLASLAICISECGCNVSMVLDHIEDMTVAELISTLGPNGVRFTLNKEKTIIGDE